MTLLLSMALVLGQELPADLLGEFDVLVTKEEHHVGLEKTSDLHAE
jgi:hypothetical protein